MIFEETTEVVETSIVTEFSETSVTMEISETLAITAEQDGETTEIEDSEYQSVLEALTAQNEQLETLVGYQADIILQQTEILQYTGYIFGILLIYGVYRFLCGVLSSIFGGG